MDAGRMDRKVIVQSRTVGRDADGAPTESWVEFRQLWAKAEALPGRKTINNDRENAAGVMRFTTYYATGIDTTMRVLHDGAYWYIYDVREVTRRKGLEIYAEVKLPA